MRDSCKYRKVFIVTLFGVLLASSALAATKGRIITDGTVSLEKDGTAVEYSQQAVLDENALITCNGNCMVKLQGVSLLASDKSKFAVKEIDNSIHLYIEKGNVDFVLSDLRKGMSFYTAQGQYVKTEGFISAASTGNAAVKGYLRSTDANTVLGMEKGSMVVLAKNGPITLKSGQAMQLAMSQVPDNKKSSAKKKTGAMFSSSKSSSDGFIVAGAMAAAGIARISLDENNNSDPASRNQ